jgi:hypothetical protein
MAKIQDATGNGFEAGVDSTNRLLVEAVNLVVREEAVLLGASFELGTLQTLTVDTELGLIFVRNNGDRTIIIDRFEFSGTASTGGSGSTMLLTLYKGAALTNGTSSAAANANFASALTLDADIETGNGSTSTVSGGTAFGSSYITFEGESTFDGPWALPRGSQIVMAATPPSGNTSMGFTVRILTHLQRSE